MLQYFWKYRNFFFFIFFLHFEREKIRIFFGEKKLKNQEKNQENNSCLFADFSRKNVPRKRKSDLLRNVFRIHNFSECKFSLSFSLSSLSLSLSRFLSLSFSLFRSTSYQTICIHSYFMNTIPVQIFSKFFFPVFEIERIMQRNEREKTSFL